MGHGISPGNEPSTMMARPGGTAVRKILELCVKMDTHAERLYAGLASVCPDPELRETFLQLRRDEAEHTDWWEGLLDAWEQGLLPDVVNDTDALTERLNELSEDLEAIGVEDLWPTVDRRDARTRGTRRVLYDRPCLR